MNDSLSSPTPGPAETLGVTLESLAEAQRRLSALVRMMLALFLVLTLSLLSFFYWEYRIARREIDAFTRVIADYQKNTEPGLEQFRRKLQAFAQAHPDFSPIYFKYFGTNAPPSGQASGAAQPLNSASPARLPPAPGR